ncbi:unnamed protein product [Urochloa humidicola]
MDAGTMRPPVPDSQFHLVACDEWIHPFSFKNHDKFRDVLGAQSNPPAKKRTEKQLVLQYPSAAPIFDAVLWVALEPQEPRTGQQRRPNALPAAEWVAGKEHMCVSTTTGKVNCL